jgi:hypothetical protein
MMSRRAFPYVLVFSSLALAVAVGGGISPKSSSSDDRNQRIVSLGRETIAQARHRENAPRRRSMGREVSVGRQTWARVFGGSLGYGGANSVQQTHDGGYIIAGQFNFYLGLSGRDAWLIKLTPEGKIEWQRAYGGNGEDTASEVEQTDDGGYICAGSTSYPGLSESDFWLWKIDPLGNLQWERAYSGFETGGATSIHQTRDGGCVVAGNAYSAVDQDIDYAVFKLGSSGEIEWQRSYGGDYEDYATAVRQTVDGGYIVAGYSWLFGIGESDIWVLKLTPAGDIEWQRAYGDQGTQWTDSIEQTRDGGYIVAGYSSVEPGQGDVWVAKLFPSGDLEWQRLYEKSGSDGAHAVRELPGGGYIVAGFAASPGIFWREVLALKLSPAGEVEWQRIYDLGGSEWAHSIQPLNNGGFILAGNCGPLLGGAGYDYLVLKIDAEGGIERLSGFIRSADVQSVETLFSPRATSAEPRPTNLVPRETFNPSRTTDAPGSLLFSPPLNVTVETAFNRSLSRAEYIHVLRWEPNPENDDLQIVKYRVYSVTGGWWLLAEVDAETLRYAVRDVGRYGEHTYAVSGVTSDNEEGLPAKVSIKWS